jgi:GTPase SAR1 family protein
MSIKLNITRGVIQRPQKVVIYGPEGIGKTSLASKFPDPLFIDTEGGSAHLDVARIECRQSWQELIETVKAVAEQDVCKTLIIDTADWAEQLAVEHLCKKYNQPSIESFGYGKGYTYLSEEFSNLLSELENVIKSGKNVVITAHAKMRKQELPDGDAAFDRWELKLSRSVAPLVKEWADMVLFLNYKTDIQYTENNVAKAKNGKRVMYTTHHSCWDAKNRQGLADMLDLDYKNISFIFEHHSLRELMARDNVTEEQIRELLKKSDSYNPDLPLESYTSKLVPKWEMILSKLSTF